MWCGGEGESDSLESERSAPVWYLIITAAAPWQIAAPGRQGVLPWCSVERIDELGLHASKEEERGTKRLKKHTLAL